MLKCLTPVEVLCASHIHASLGQKHLLYECDLLAKAPNFSQERAKLSTNMTFERTHPTYHLPCFKVDSATAKLASSVYTCSS